MCSLVACSNGQERCHSNWENLSVLPFPFPPSLSIPPSLSLYTSLSVVMSGWNSMYRLFFFPPEVSSVFILFACCLQKTKLWLPVPHVISWSQPLNLTYSAFCWMLHHQNMTQLLRYPNHIQFIYSFSVIQITFQHISILQRIKHMKNWQLQRQCPIYCTCVYSHC